MTHTLRFDEPLATQLDLTGGKGANLALLTQRDFPVPRGFVVTAPVYRAFIAGAGERLRSVSALPFHDPAALRAASVMLRADLLQLPLPQCAADEIAERLGQFPEGTAFSVRSSSTMEDLAGAAFAGQHDTFLNVAGVSDVLDRVRACFVSLWTDRALAYRHQQGFDHAQAAMAVVVQQMVSSAAAGVAFSINPVNGQMGEMVINANFGLGESVVSGEGEVDQWILDKSTRAVRSASIACKSRRVVGAASGTREVHITGADAVQPSLGAEQLAQLADMLVRVEASYAFPQDIEWAFAGGQLWLLQARPITTVPPRWTRDESAERFPNAITPLTWDFVDEGFHHSLAASFRLIGFPPCRSAWFALHDHYVYGNQNLVDLYLRHPVFAPHSLDDVRTALPVLRERFQWVQDLPARWSRDLDHYLLRLGAFAVEPLEPLDARGVWQHVAAVQELAVDYFAPNIAISITQATLHGLLAHLTRMVAAEDAERLLDGLLAHVATKTAAINRELFELAALARADPALERCLRDSAARALAQAGALSAFPAFAARCARFLRDHGHREVEFDMYHAPWGEAPWIVLDHIRLILNGPMDVPPEAQERLQKIRSQEAEFELLQRAPADLRFFFHELIRLVRVYTALDDLEHYQTMRLSPVMRRGLRALGRRIGPATGCEDPLDIYFARRAQISAALVAGTPVALRALGAQIRVQKEAWQRDRGRTPDWEPGCAAATPAAGTAALKGLPGSPGCAAGPVRMVRGPDDFADFPKGAVLVARTTNPAWTPLFYNAAAVITESGGPLSHGAVTAREMGIPAVMSVRGVMAALRNGQLVWVDGAAGLIIHDPAQLKGLLRD